MIADETRNEGIVALLSACDFPHGLAAPFRIRMLARSFGAIGLRSVCVIQYAPGVAGEGANQTIEGEVEGIRFMYAVGTTAAPKSIWRMFYYKTWGLWKVMRATLQLHKREGVRYVLSYGNTAFEDTAYLFLARFIGARFLIEICDEANVVLSEGWVNRSLLGKAKESVKYGMHRLKDWLLVPKADALFVISEGLAQRYQDRISKDRILVVPVIGDKDASIDCRARRETGSPQIVWIGNFRPFEGLEFLMAALAELSRARWNYRCDLYGVTRKHRDYFERIRSVVDEQGIGRQVRMLDAVPHDRISGILADADVLVIPRQDVKVNQTNLPTKLVDYLLSGRPVVSSKVGEIPRYLQHKRDVIYPNDHTPKAFAAAVAWTFEHKAEADVIGKRGCELAQRLFDYRSVGRRIGNFLERQGLAG